ncbi:extracellular solute-binding protein [Bifidobacterium psychraerophilum]|jgi:raffinose/stachyose/melibiose transport system substrate-binding protein|uniref:ABC-type sugar transport system, periplasmic component n=1 Tax=Bifidobacterium psychraerophilum TaxID=218140 RepID=A0A087CG04_9BIFI|nr:extracellular solute-binding protein [Bifidobacterium psychraerophilum]KFI82204.1 ABC-type sugar transport system, periplasmic component [Bifidobacterium psychraerophilum]PKA95008.1 raffinose/stachyose/melibiose transport system substrate-binding protein [Bifidobacterium psychraerophilum DSM 22366]
MKVKKAQTIAAAALAVMSCVGLSACGGSDSNADGKVEVTVWHNSTAGDGKKYWEDAAAAYEKQNPNVDIKIEAIQNEDMDGKLQTALQDPNSAPDIFLARGGQKLADVVEAGQAMDLSDKVSDTVKTQMASSLSAYTIDGKLYAVPQAVQPGGMWYSKDLFAKAGITQTPKTWDEFKAAIAKLKAAGITPIAVGGKDAWPAAHWWYWFALRECSADVFAKAQKSKDFSDDCWSRTGKDVEDLLGLDAFNEGFLTTPAQQGANSSAGLLANHMAAMELMGGWEAGVVRDLTPDKKDLPDLGFFAFPTVEGGEGDPSAVMGGVDAMAVGSWAPSEAVDFLNFIAEKGQQEQYANAFSTIPASKEAQSVVTNDALKQELAVYDQASSVSLWLDTVFGQNIGNALNEGVVNLMAGKGSSADIIKGVESAAAKG